MPIELKSSVTVIDYSDGTSNWQENISRQWAISNSREQISEDTEWADTVLSPTKEKPYSWIKDTKIRIISNPGIPYLYEDGEYYFGPLEFVDINTNKIEYATDGDTWNIATIVEKAGRKQYIKFSTNPVGLRIREVISLTPICQSGINGKNGTKGDKGDKGNDGTDGISPSFYYLTTSAQTYRVGEAKTITYYINKMDGVNVTQVQNDQVTSDKTNTSAEFLIEINNNISIDVNQGRFTIPNSTKEAIVVTLSKRDGEIWTVVDAETIEGLAAGTYNIILDNDTVSRPKSKTAQDTVTATLYYGELKVACDWEISPNDWNKISAETASSCQFKGAMAGTYTVTAKISTTVVATKTFRVISIEEGQNAKYVVLSTTATAFIKGSGNAITPDSIIITANIINAETDDKITYSWYKDNSEIANANSTILNVSNDSYSGQHMYKCVANISGKQSEDSITIPLLENGEDAYTVILQNENFNIPVKANNTIADGGIKIVIAPLVWKGTSAQTVSNPQISMIGSSGASGEWFEINNGDRTIILKGGEKIPNNYATGTVVFEVNGITFEKSFTITAVPAGEVGDKGNDGVSPSYYSIEANSLIHRGTLQKESINFKFYKTVGENKKISKEGYYYYGFGSIGSEGYSLQDKNEIKIEPNSFKNQYKDFQIEWWSDDKTKSGSVLYDAETVEFASSSYALALSQNVIVLPADSEGNVFSFDNANLFAQLYLNGEALPDKTTDSSVGAEYTWSLSNPSQEDNGQADGKNYSLKSLGSDSVTLTCTAKYFYGDTNPATTLTATAMFVKVKDGAKGAKGDEGAKGEPGGKGDSAIQYVIETNYDEIGVAYAAVANGGTKAKQLQYYPNNTIKIALKKIDGAIQSYLTEGKISYDIQPSLADTKELPLTGQSTDFAAESWGAIKLQEAEYSSYADKERYIHLYYEGDNNVTLAEKYIYLVHARSNILANFETTAFGFNDLTADGTKGIKFTADGGMELFAGDAEIGKDMFTIWNGKATDGEHGDKVFYVDNNGNAFFSGEIVASSGKVGNWAIVGNNLVCDYGETATNYYKISLRAPVGENNEKARSVLEIEAGGRYEYELLLDEPNDWQENYTNYYTIDRDNRAYIQIKELENNDAPKFSLGQYYTRKRLDDKSYTETTFRVTGAGEVYLGKSLKIMNILIQNDEFKINSLYSPYEVVLRESNLDFTTAYPLDEQSSTVTREQTLTSAGTLIVASSIANYSILDGKPSDWESNYNSYYRMGENGSLTEVTSSNYYGANHYYKYISAYPLGTTWNSSILSNSGLEISETHQYTTGGGEQGPTIYYEDTNKTLSLDLSTGFLIKGLNNTKILALNPYENGLVLNSYDTNNSSVTGQTGVGMYGKRKAFWAGTEDYETREDEAPFNVDHSGNVIMNNLNFKGNYSYDKRILVDNINLYMNANQSVDLNYDISDQPNGIVLVWSLYSSNAAQNNNFNYTFIPKYSLTLDNGYGICCPLYQNNSNDMGCKYLYIGHKKITGNAMNGNNSPNNTNYQNKNWVLRAVIGV